MKLKYDSNKRILSPARRIMVEYCERYSIDMAELLGPSREQPLARIRQDCMAEIFHGTDLSRGTIAKLMSRDYKTIHHGIRASEARQ